MARLYIPYRWTHGRWRRGGKGREGREGGGIFPLGDLYFRVHLNFAGWFGWFGWVNLVVCRLRLRLRVERLHPSVLEGDLAYYDGTYCLEADGRTEWARLCSSWLVYARSRWC